MCEIRRIKSENELNHYKHFLAPKNANLDVKNTIQTVAPQTLCKPIKESENFGGNQIAEILPSGYTAEQEEQLLWEAHLYKLQMQQEYDRN